MSIDSSYEVFRDFNFSTSAKQTGRVLAVVSESQNGKKLQVLRSIDLKNSSFWTKLSLWWNNSCDLATVAHFVQNHQAKWVRVDEQQARLEEQCAWLFRKCLARDNRDGTKNTYNHPYRWKLHLNIEYPTNGKRVYTELWKVSKKLKQKQKNSALDNLYKTVEYDRLSTLQGIDQKLRDIPIIFKWRFVNFAYFKTKIFTGKYQGEATSDRFLKPSEKGKDETIFLQLDDLESRQKPIPMDELAYGSGIDLGSGY